jgi:hypothetical protein
MWVNTALIYGLLMAVFFFTFGSNGTSKTVGFIWMILMCAAMAERFA